MVTRAVVDSIVKQALGHGCTCSSKLTNIIMIIDIYLGFITHFSRLIKCLKMIVLSLRAIRKPTAKQRGYMSLT